MRIKSNIVVLILSASGMILGSLPVTAHTGTKKKTHKVQHKHAYSIGLRAGKALSYTPNIHGFKSGSPSQLNTNTVFVSRHITHHIAIETDLTYNTSREIPGFHSSTFQPYRISIPVITQFYPLSEKSRIQPYCGAGFQYNINVSPSNISPFSGEVENPHSIVASGTKYISIMFVQGVTFEISTRIQVNESFHFVPGTNKTIGVDLGIGYKLP